ncbi:MAG: bifunctional precorrin-2 dehydrogenase/sirohydrochlorin ferrochelatase [Deltaproteobacteria bacterium]|nr:bifunctional precorrin-2 dehydrogenase/sirohydrochlorin ferrochelatase [Deltaproteobacteria bacterium]
MPYYPICVDLEGKKALVVGGGRVAERKICTLLEYGARVFVVARDLTPLLARYAEQGKVTILGGGFQEENLEGVFLVVAATDDSLTNRRVSESARERGLLVNAVDQPADCNFIVPSVLRRGDLSISVSTSGKSPALARRIREGLEKRFGPEYGSFLALMGHVRREILSRGLSQEENSRMFHELSEGSILETLGREDWEEAARILSRILDRHLSAEDVMQYVKGS